MHIPDAVLAPEVAALTGVAGAAGFGYGLRRLEGGRGERTTVLMGIMAALVFAAQMVKFPVGPGVAGHLLGGVLAAVLLGPWAGAGAIGAVLIVQCLLFGDGGLTALGANFVNLGLIGSLGGYAIYAPIRRARGGRAGILLGAMAAAWFSVLLAAGALAVELAASSRWAAFPRLLGWMALVHAGIGLGEAIVTGLVLRLLLLRRPDLVYEPGPGAASAPRRWGEVVVAGLAIALALAVVIAPCASTAPDGLEWVSRKLGLAPPGSSPVLPAPFPDYEVLGLRGPVGIATAAAGLVGTLVVFGFGLGLAGRFSGESLKAEGPKGQRDEGTKGRRDKGQRVGIAVEPVDPSW
jgi:cobalt/nickel transport system permease protein